MPFWKRVKVPLRFLFFCLGCVISILGFIGTIWFSYSPVPSGLSVRSHLEEPEWIPWVRQALQYCPLFALAIALVGRIYIGKGIRLFSFAVGLAPPYVFLLGLIKFGPSIQDYWHSQPFEAQAWRNAGEDCSSYWMVRSTMAKDLIDSGFIRGKKKTQVELLLGPTDHISKIRPFGSQSTDSTSWDMGYCLGAKAWAHPYFVQWLVVKLGPDGTAVKLGFKQDYRIPGHDN